jgi:predicted ATPase
VTWIELASLRDPQLVPAAVASALGVREEGERPLTEVLATSRVRLRLRGERELPVPPLPMPTATAGAAPPLAGLAGVPAVRLFINRASDVRPGFALAPENAAASAALGGTAFAAAYAAGWALPLESAMAEALAVAGSSAPTAASRETIAGVVASS